MLIKRNSYVVFFPLEYNYQTIADLLFNENVEDVPKNIQVLFSPSKDVYDTLLNILASDLIVFTHAAKTKTIDDVVQENPEAIMWLRVCEREGRDFLEEDLVENLKEEIKGRYEKWNQK